MAIVEDEVRNDSEEENEIEVVVEEDDGDQDSGDDDTDDDEDEEAMENKVAELEKRIADDPYNYNDHIELIQTLWGVSELERWRSAFEQLQQLSLIKADHWLLRLQTEISLAHSEEALEQIAQLFQQALKDCYSIPILSEWCSWSVSQGSPESAREHMNEVLKLAGADPFSGKLFWDAKAELERSQLESKSEEDPTYKEQMERLLFCLEEIISRPLLRGEEAWPQLEELSAKIRDQQYIEKVKKQHEAAVDFLQKITPYEDKLLTLENPEDKLQVYEEYIKTVKELSREEKYAECDGNGILRVLFERASTDCSGTGGALALLQAMAAHARAHCSRARCARVIDTCIRRAPRNGCFWVMKMHHAEREGKSFDEVKSILEMALSKGLESYADTESVWMCYLEYIRRRTDFDDPAAVDTLRRTQRLAWDSLAEAWGEQANDSAVPLYWARLEYRRLRDPKQGKEIFEEIFRYGENKTLSKYWEAFIQLESTRDPPLSTNKLRELHKRAVKFTADYPPAVTRLWIDYERDFGSLDDLIYCKETCDAKLKEWKESYQAMKDKMSGQKQKGKQMQKKGKPESKKGKMDSKTIVKGKRKIEGSTESGEVKKKRDSGVVLEEKERDSGGTKRSHEDDGGEATESKRQRTDSDGSDLGLEGREASTLFVSNLEFKVNEQRLRDKLSQFGEIVSLRVRAGVKAFGGSICYCQYKSPESVTEALKHDRSPLDGRPMFLSRYSSKKGDKQFKYSTGTEKNKLFVKNLPFGHCTKEKLAEVFDKYGTLKDVRIVTFKDGKPKGLAYIEYSDEQSAAEALKHTHGLQLADRKIDVAVSAPPPRAAAAAAASLGAPKRDPTGGMRRTQLSSFIPSVLQRATTNKTAPATSTANGNHSNGDAANKPLSNSDFRSMLLKK